MTDDMVQFLRDRLDDDKDHALRHDPARVLADIEAKRQMVDAYVEAGRQLVDAAPESEFAYGRSVGLGIAVCLLALPYASHPDYRPEWRP